MTGAQHEPPAQPHGIADQRIKAATFREIVGLSWPTVMWAVRRGDMIPVGPGRTYAVADLLRLLPMLWDELAEARCAIARLEKTVEDATAAADESRAGARRAFDENTAYYELLVMGVMQDRTRRLWNPAAQHNARYAHERPRPSMPVAPASTSVPRGGLQEPGTQRWVPRH